jgi:hypothetical protein
VRKAYAVLVAVAVSAASVDVRAEGLRVALVSVQPELIRALDSALTPWALTVVAVDRASGLGAAMPRAAEGARSVARDEGADAVVWISRDGDDHALWIYDTEADRVVAKRLVEAPPYDDAMAVAVALSVKTLLRHSAVAPPAERYAGGAAVAPKPRRAGPQRTLELGVGSRRRGDRWEPRAGASAGLWLSPRLAVLATMSTGSGIDISAPLFVGRFDVVLFDLVLRRRWHRGAASLDGGLGLGLHFSRVDGAETAGGLGVRVRRTNPAAGAGVGVGYALGPVRLGARAVADVMVRRQRYTAAGAEVLDLPRLELGLQLELAAEPGFW